MIILDFQNDLVKEWSGYIQRILRPSRLESNRVTAPVRRAFGENFRRERGGGIRWRRLAPYTQRDRIRKGYGGPGPKLVRTRRLKTSYVKVRARYNVSQFERTGVAEGEFQAGSRHPIAPAQEYGNPSNRTPPRVVTALVSRQVRAIDDAVLDYLDTIIIP